MAQIMPVLFVGHGSPMNAIEDNEFSNAWEEIGKKLPKPKAILAISAHWETSGTKVTAMEKPKTIYDFYGFPQELFEVSYPAPGSPDLAQTIRKVIKVTEVQPDMTWGLDHGTWSVLKRMFPTAEVPVVQMSLDRTKGAEHHYLLGQHLKELREEGVLIISSGNIVHNLRRMVWDNNLKFDWAETFDARINQWILDNDHEPIIQFEKQGPDAQLSINSAEHYLPLLYTLGSKIDGEPLNFFTNKITYGSISMRSIMIG